MEVNNVSHWVSQVYRSYVSPDQLDASKLLIFRLFEGLVREGGGWSLVEGGKEGGVELRGVTVKLFYLGVVLVKFLV